MKLERLYLQQGKTLLATLYAPEYVDMFWQSYKYTSEKTFPQIRQLFEKATELIELEPLQSDEIWRDLFYMDVKLVNAETNDIYKHFILHVNDDHLMLRFMFFSRSFILKKDDIILAEFTSCEDNADRQWWCVCQAEFAHAFAEYHDLFFEASQLLQEKRNPERVQEIYAQLRENNIRLFEVSEWAEDGLGREHHDFTLRFQGDSVYICEFDNCD